LKNTDLKSVFLTFSLNSSIEIKKLFSKITTLCRYFNENKKLFAEKVRRFGIC
jgi:hypothetical protein